MLALVALGAATAATLRVHPPASAPWLMLAAIGGLFALYFGAAHLVLRCPQRFGVQLAVVGGAALQAIAVQVAPRNTDDYLRYAWDGRVQAAGISPYRYPPGAPELAFLRDDWLFDGTEPLLNHPSSSTIYPPVAQAWFWLVHVVSGGAGRQVPMQLGMALLAVATAVAIVVVLRRTGGDQRLVVWWAWCPTVVLEAGNNAHIDVLAAMLTVVALGALALRRWSSGGVLLGLAVATKVLPLLVAAAVSPRRSLRVGIAAALAVAAVYLPHVIALGGVPTGFLGGYLDEESLGRFRLLKAVLPDGGPVTAAALLILAATAVLVWRHADRTEAAGRPLQPWHGAAVMVGISFIVLTPSYSWYALVLVPLVALGARPAWLWVVAAGYPVYSGEALPTGLQGTRVVSYGLAALLVAAAYAYGSRPAAGRGRRP